MEEDFIETLRKRRFLPEYAEHVENAPDPADFKQGTSGKLLTALLGGLTGMTSGAPAALKFTDEIKRRPYNDAVQRHQTRGKGLQDLAREEGDIIEQTRRHNLSQDQLGLQKGNQDLQRDKFEHDQSQAEQDAAFKDIDATLKEDQANRLNRQQSESERHNKSMEGIARNRANKPTGSFNPNRPVIEPYIRKAEQDVTNEMAAESPRYMKFVQRDKSGYVNGLNAQAAHQDPEGFKLFMNERRRRTRQRLNTPTMGGMEDIEDDNDLVFER